MPEPAAVDISYDPERFEEAVRAWRERIPLTDEEYESILEGERAFAFKVAGVAQADLVTEVWQAIDRALRDGTAFEEFQEEVGEKLERAWSGSVASPAARLATIFRTNVQSAYGAGRWRQMRARAVKQARPYWRFDAIEDNRTSDICEELDNTVRPADDPWWASHNPPLHHNCRSTIHALSEDEAREYGVDEKAPEVDADEGFGGAPGDEEWDPDVNDYPEPVGSILEDRLADT